VNKQIAMPLAGTAGAIALALALAAAPQTANANVFLSTNGGAACKPAYGASTKFNFTEYYALNNSTTDQYVVCSFANFSVGSSSTAQPVKGIYFSFDAGATPGTAVCTVKMGYWMAGAHTASQSSKSVTVAANSNGVINFSNLDLPRSFEFEALSVNCKVPGGFKLGLIQRTEPEPVSGSGWTP